MNEFGQCPECGKAYLSETRECWQGCVTPPPVAAPGEGEEEEEVVE